MNSSSASAGRQVKKQESRQVHHLHAPMIVAATQDFIEKLKTGGQPRLDGPTGKAVLQFALAALQSAASGREVRPEEVH